MALGRALDLSDQQISFLQIYCSFGFQQCSKAAAEMADSKCTCWDIHIASQHWPRLAVRNRLAHHCAVIRHMCTKRSPLLSGCCNASQTLWWATSRWSCICHLQISKLGSFQARCGCWDPTKAQHRGWVESRQLWKPAVLRLSLHFHCIFTNISDSHSSQSFRQNRQITVEGETEVLTGQVTCPLTLIWLQGQH